MNEQLSFKQVSSEIYACYGKSSIIPILYGIASIFSEEIVSKTGSFPLLILRGAAATGKSVLSDSIRSMVNEKSSGVTILGGMKDFTKTLLYHVQVAKITIIDEYDPKPKNDVFLKAAYDKRKFYTGTLAHNEVDSRAFKGNLIILAQSTESFCKTILNRSICVDLPSRDYTDQDNDNFMQLISNHARNKNICCYEEIKGKEAFIDHFFKSEFTSAKGDISSKYIFKNVRDLYNICTLISVYNCLCDELKFPFFSSDFHEVIEEFIKNDYNTNYVII